MRKRTGQKEERIKAESAVRIMIVSDKSAFSVWVEGAKKILLCLSDRVRILLGKDVLCLSGSALECVTYVGGALEIKGHINEIRFESWSGRNDCGGEE